MRHLDGLVNNFNSTILEMMRCNMDIQFMGSGPSTKAVIYYITDYITKAQLKAHVTYAALELAVKKLEEIDVTDDSQTVRAKKLLQKCAYSIISKQELSSQQIASYVLDLEDHFTNHEFKYLYWTSFEQFVNCVYPLYNHQSSVVESPDETDVEVNSLNVNEMPFALNACSVMSPVMKETDDLDYQPSMDLEPDEVVIDCNFEIFTVSRRF